MLLGSDGILVIIKMSNSMEGWGGEGGERDGSVRGGGKDVKFVHFDYPLILLKL